MKYFGGDRVIWLLIVILTIYSAVAVASSVASVAYRNGGNVTVYIIRHSAFLIAGWFIIYITHLIPYKWYSMMASLLMLVAVVLLAFTLTKKLGVERNQASRWLKVPGIGVKFQTSDFAKLVLIIFVSRYLSRNQAGIENLKTGLLPVLFWILLICGLILPENFSTSAMLFLTSIILLFIGRVKMKYLLLLAAIGLIVVVGYMSISSYTGAENRTKTWENRIESFVHGKGDGFQTTKAKIAIANGGLMGKFAGHSTQRHSLPHADSDFIFAIIIEEYGLLFGALPLLFIYLVLLYRAGVIVRRCDRTFPAFLAIGLMLMLVIQALVNMGVATGVLPVTGQTLPWISRGGTSIIVTSLSLGIILGISRSLDEAPVNA
ncbi:MAG: FtsW/RodA/SpoVE family cell cycle protein [Bacteroidales bacterium]|nr:FtsW/RodA/SpoVE family cell cycle protein [Bacteroidales bacterium]